MLYFKPDDGWAGDPVPFYWEGKFHLFYVKEIYRPPLYGWRHFWGHVVSDDLIHWQECPDAIPIGQDGDVDSASCGTGSVFYDGQLFHIYYLGRYFTTQAEIRETLCHATSSDLINWKKDPANPIYRPDSGILKPEACRDPFPLWNEEKGHYSMIFTAQLPDRPLRRSGCLASIKSSDLKDWEFEEIFFAPNIWDCLECPDIFKWGDWWYLIYSSAGITTYRRARTLDGPWECPPVDALDGDQFYAAKTAFDGERRILFGWVPSREEERDEGRREWGGVMAIREIVRDEEGYLWTKNPDERADIGNKVRNYKFYSYWDKRDVNGTKKKVNSLTLDNPDGFSYLISSEMVADYYLSTFFEAESDVKAFGFFFRASQDLEQGYLLRIEPESNNIRLYRMVKGIPYPVHDRYLPLEKDKVSFEVILKDSILDIYVDNKLSLVSRVYDYSQGELALFIDSGSGKFKELEIKNITTSRIDE